MTGSSRALKILWVCTGRILEPCSGGELRIHHLTRELARRGHRVDVLALVVRNHPAREGRPVEGLTIREIHSPWLDAAAVADRLRLVPITELPLWLRPLRGWRRLAAALAIEQGRPDLAILALNGPSDRKFYDWRFPLVFAVLPGGRGGTRRLWQPQRGVGLVGGPVGGAAFECDVPASSARA